MFCKALGQKYNVRFLPRTLFVYNNRDDILNIIGMFTILKFKMADYRTLSILYALIVVFAYVFTSKILQTTG